MKKWILNLLAKYRRWQEFKSPEAPVMKPDLYTSIDVPIRVFRDALVNEDFSQFEDFQNTYLDYCLACGGEELEKLLEKQKDIANLEAKHVIGQSCIDALKSAIPPHMKTFFFEKLVKLGYPSTITEYSEENVTKLIAQVQGHISLDQIKAEMKRLELAKGNKKEVVYSADYFARMLVEFMATIKVTLNENDSLRLYCQCVVMYKQYCKAQQNKPTT